MDPLNIFPIDFLIYCSKINVIEAIPFSVSSVNFVDESTLQSMLSNSALLEYKISSYLYTSGTDNFSISPNADSKDTPGKAYSALAISIYCFNMSASIALLR